MILTNIRFFDIAKHVANETIWFNIDVCDEIKNKTYNIANLIKNKKVFVRTSLNLYKKSIFKSKFDWFSYYLQAKSRKHLFNISNILYF